MYCWRATITVAEVPRDSWKFIANLVEFSLFFSVYRWSLWTGLCPVTREIYFPLICVFCGIMSGIGLLVVLSSFCINLRNNTSVAKVGWSCCQPQFIPSWRPSSSPSRASKMTRRSVGVYLQKKIQFMGDTKGTDDEHFQIFRTCANSKCEKSDLYEIDCCSEDLCNAASPSTIYSFAFALVTSAVARYLL